MVLLLGLVAAASVVAETSWACSLQMCLNGGPGVQSSFHVLVRDGENPLKGAGVRIYRIQSGTGEPYRVGTTGDDGKLRVAKLPEGQYDLELEFLGMHVASECFHVGRRPPLGAKRSLRYNIGEGVPETRLVRGAMVQWLPGHLQDALQRQSQTRRVPFAQQVIWLRDVSGSAGTNGITGDDGSFFFPQARPGLFTLAVPDGGDPGGPVMWLMLRLNPSASQEELTLVKQESNCGPSLRVQ